MSWAGEWADDRNDVERPWHWLRADPRKIRADLYEAACGTPAQPCTYGPVPHDMRCLRCLELAGDEIAAYDEDNKGVVFA